MIRNTDLYSFDEEKTTEDPTTEEGLQPETGQEVTGRGWFLYQTIIATIFLIGTLLICYGGVPYGHWLRERLHIAIGTSNESAIAQLANSEIVKSVTQNCSRLIRLEEITGKNNPKPNQTGIEVLKNSVWPIQGNIVKGFGWVENPDSHIREFNPGITMVTDPDSMVITIAGGTVIDTRQQDGVWQVIVDHGSGWHSSYRGLKNSSVKPGQKVDTGAEIGRLGIDGSLWLELTDNNRPVDPLSILNR